MAQVFFTSIRPFEFFIPHSMSGNLSSKTSTSKSFLSFGSVNCLLKPGTPCRSFRTRVLCFFHSLSLNFTLEGFAVENGIDGVDTFNILLNPDFFHFFYLCFWVKYGRRQYHQQLTKICQQVPVNCL